MNRTEDDDGGDGKKRQKRCICGEAIQLAARVHIQTGTPAARQSFFIARTHRRQDHFVRVKSEKAPPFRFVLRMCFSMSFYFSISGISCRFRWRCAVAALFFLCFGRFSFHFGARRCAHTIVYSVRCPHRHTNNLSIFFIPSFRRIFRISHIFHSTGQYVYMCCYSRAHVCECERFIFFSIFLLAAENEICEHKKKK